MSKPVGVSENPTAASFSEKLTLTAAELERIAEHKMMAHRKKSEKQKKDGTSVNAKYTFV